MLRPCESGSPASDEWARGLFQRRLNDLHHATASVLPQAGALASMAENIAKRLRVGGKVMLAGNGGSACQAQHFAAELLGRLRV
jgi:phosphoheptose isomerase